MFHLLKSATVCNTKLLQLPTVCMYCPLICLFFERNSYIYFFTIVYTELGKTVVLNYEGIKPQFLTPWSDHSRAFAGGSLGQSAVRREEAWPPADQGEARPGADLRVRG
jgi:hypothetical protein